MAPDALLRRPSAESSRGALKHPCFGFSARAPGFDLHRRPPPPNNSFKPTPCRGVSRVPALRLHTSAAPPRVGLTPALGRMKVYQFSSNLFEVEPDEDEEINPRMYGRQLAHWLKNQLEMNGYTVEPIINEDWGRCLMCSREPFMLWVGCGNSPDYLTAKPGDPPPAKEDIIWSCFAEAELSLWQRYVKRLDTSEALTTLDTTLLNILSSERRIKPFEE